VFINTVPAAVSINSDYVKSQRTHMEYNTHAPSMNLYFRCCVFCLLWFIQKVGITKTDVPCACPPFVNISTCQSVLLSHTHVIACR